MSTPFEPNPPSRRSEDFPKTNTIPDGWVSGVLMDVYNNPAGAREDGPQYAESAAVPDAGTNGRTKTNGRSHSVQPPVETPAAPAESLFARQLDPYPSDLSRMYL